MQKIQTHWENINRKHKRLIKTLQTIWIYKLLISSIKNILKPAKMFIIIWGKGFWKVKGIISLSTYKLLWKKIGYIDDFVINKKARGKWLWKKLILDTMKKSQEYNHDYVTLISEKQRIASHRLYKKVWFSIISLWAFVFAYKKIKKKK